ncbi:hypothetical protein [Microbacterium oxydans]|uniref:hypothetical protein n=1 Tax=Microbacterium oxydans TaxID=82380 RepID=UPI0022B12527|nr:hypothetical protein [Microbacterium oxydans]MCZ4300487.1 hypothetical protein [Microbacterium oxydans]
MGSPVYGEGFYDGRRSVSAELRTAASAAKVQKHSNNIGLAASVTGAVIVQLIPVVVKAWKDGRRLRDETPTPQA